MKKIPWTAIGIALTIIGAIVNSKEQKELIKEEVKKALQDRQ